MFHRQRAGAKPLDGYLDFHQLGPLFASLDSQSRTDFSWHLRRSFDFSLLQRSELSTTALPLPLPSSSTWCWGSFPKLSRRLSKLARARLLHVVVLALNHLYLGRYPSLAELGRRPTAAQTVILSRLRSHLAVCWSSDEPFPVAPGRSGPELVSALCQLEAFVDACPMFQSNYIDGPVGFKEDPSLFPADEFPQLVPYRSLDASRLRLVGEGVWPMEKFIRGPLWLPFQEPAFLRHGLAIDEACAPNFQKESRSECLELMKIWDAKGLLRLFDAPPEPGMFCRVFNAFKNSEQDRQIGDRRRVNMAEMSYDGPSKFLPPGQLLTQISLARFSQKLVASVTHRRDFYHQAAVMESRAQTNLLPFCYPLSDLSGLSATLDFLEKPNGKVSSSREVIGDRLGLSCKKKSRCGSRGPKSLLFGGFASLFQGDHLGVEFALCSHQTLLEDEGLLDASHQVQGYHCFPKGPRYSGLVIDDYFMIGREPANAPACETSAFAALESARTVYAREGLLGSAEKDVVAADVFKASGAEIVSDPRAVRSGYVTVGSPRSKRLALALLSLRTARLPGITPKLASRLAGNWSSVLLYRKCLSCVVDDLFAVGALPVDSPHVVVPLTREVAKELVLLATLAPLMSTNVATEYLGALFASDASLSKGAYVVTEISPGTAEELWLDSDKKGAYSLRDNGFRAILEHVGEGDFEEEMPEPPLVKPKASPLLYFDFVEICGGVGAVTKAASGLGLVCAPPLDLSASKHYDIGDLRAAEWIIYMIETNRFASFLCEPPCTTFSPAAYPNLRSYQLPYGYDRDHPRVVHGNCLAFRCLVFLRVGRRHRRPCGLEPPRRSKMAWLREWMSLVMSGDFAEAVIAACRFGSPHQKEEFRFLVHGLSVGSLEARCTHDHSHVRIQGKYTKDSAIYTPELGLHLALAFRHALRGLVVDDNDGPTCEGLESLVVNDLMCTNEWRVEKAWTWKRPSHINVLETSAGLAVLSHVATLKPHCRFVSCLDSSVARGALAKGRSTSRMLQPLLRKAAVIQLCFDLYPVWPYCPTRLNVADDPTRDEDTRSPQGLSLRRCPGVDFRLLHRSGLRRFAANWVRLSLLAVCCLGAQGSPGGLQPDLNSSFGFLQGSGAQSRFLWTFQSIFSDFAGPWNIRLTPFFWSCLDDLCLGCFLLLRFLCLTFASVWCLGLLLQLPRSGRLLRFIGLLSVVASPARFLDLHLGALAMEPTSAAERKRAAVRSFTELAGDRVVLESTRKRRGDLLQKFQSWLWLQKGVSLTYLLSERPPDPEKICSWLVLYGKELYRSGKAYGIFAETINAVSSARPILRKQMTLAWDLAYSWVAGEPFSHHAAMPASVLIALLAIAILWGWLTEAAILAMSCAGLLRIGEALQACRRDLVLPKDAAPGTQHALLKIREPKTRGRHAKLQAARIDPSDIVLLLELAFSQKAADEKLWPLSVSTLCKRLGDLMRALKLPQSDCSREKPFDLSSLRPGGASWLLNTSEDSELVRRRGRWATTKTMEIYLQEVLYVTYVEKLPLEAKNMIEVCAASFPELHRHAQYFVSTAVPCSTWYTLLRNRREAGQSGVNGAKTSAFARKTRAAE